MDKTCYFCGEKVWRGTGTYYKNRLFHKRCVALDKGLSALREVNI